jgi:hypothetical protein
MPTPPTLLTLTLIAGNSGSKTGYRNPASGYKAIGSISGTPEWSIGGQLFRLEECDANSAVANDFMMRVSHATITPPNTDASWSFIALTGTFAGSGGTGRHVLTRASHYVTNNGTTPNGRQQRMWQLNQAALEMISGNAYTFELG